jgi:cell wall-associated NlpC family hydrolase
MFSKKILPCISFFLLTFSTLGYAQIVTSKKVAIQKGIYQKPEEKKKLEPITEKLPKDAVIGEKKKAESSGEKHTRLIAVAENKKDLKAFKAGTKSKKYLVDNVDDSDLLPTPSEDYLAVQLINNAMAFVGVKYHGGGTNTSGMDCSGMVTAVFNIFDLKLPRSSHEMAAVGEKREQKDIQKGDLIFFKTNGRGVINHVGMVIDVLSDEIKFVHSSTSKGVMVSSTKEPYYKKTFVQANKVL